MLEYKSKYTDILFFASAWYFFMSLLDFTITMRGYHYLRHQFFDMELNPYICSCLEHGFPPIYMFLIPFTLVILSYWFIKPMEKYDRCKLPNTYILGIWFAILLIINLGIIHVLGFLSWFYYGIL